MSSNSIFLPMIFSIGDRIELKNDEPESEDTSGFPQLLVEFCRGFGLLYGKDGLFLYLQEYVIKKLLFISIF